MVFGIEVTCAEDRSVTNHDLALALINVLQKELGSLAVNPIWPFGCSPGDVVEVNVGIKPPTIPE
jgi:hypothetical protein